MARVGEFLPSRDFLERFHELGGRIVTVGSDAHSADRVGENTERAAKLAADIFGYVCTFAGREPIFHKI
jgi:histidinol-phosphatase (PHP family)